MMTKHVVFACSSGVATSTVVAERVKEYCAENGIKVEARQAIFGELSQLDQSADLFVVTAQVGASYQTPVVNAMAIITGVGEQEVLDEIVMKLKG